MSTTPSLTETPTSELTNDEFQRLFEEAQKREKGGSPREFRAAVEEVEQRLTGQQGTLPPAPEEPIDVEAPETPVEAAAPPEATTPAPEGQEAQVAPATTAEEDWLASLDPAIRSQVEKLQEELRAKEHYIKSNDGRVAAEQRKARQLEQQLLQTRQQQAAPKPPVTAAEKKEEDERLKALKEADEFLGSYLQEQEEKRAALEARLAQFEERVTNDQKAQLDRHAETEINRLGQMVTNFNEIWESEAYQYYMKEEAPPRIQRAAASPTAEGAAEAIFAYGKWVESQIGQAQQPASTSAVATTSNPAAVAQAQKIQQERDRKSSTAPVTSSVVTRPSVVPNDPMEQVMTDPNKLDKWIAEQTERERKKLLTG